MWSTDPATGRSDAIGSHPEANDTDVDIDALRLTRFSHSCVRIERDGRVLVVDPGIWSEPAVLDGADAVLLTHVHFDHADPTKLARLEIPIFAPNGESLDGVTTIAVGDGEVFDAAGFSVRSVGGWHAPVTPEQAPYPNLGYVIDGAIYHPGDALFVPGEAIAVVLVPMQASWLKTGEAMELLRSVPHERAIGIHDGQINERGLASINRWLRLASASYAWMAPGESLDVPVSESAGS